MQNDNDHTADGPVAPTPVLARQGDRSALAELGRRGGKARAARALERATERAAKVLLSTVEDRRAVLAQCVQALVAGGVDDARKTTAVTTAIRELNAMDGFEAMAKELDQLRAEVVAYRAASLTTDKAIRLVWGGRVDDEPARDLPAPSGVQ